MTHARDINVFTILLKSSKVMIQSAIVMTPGSAYLSKVLHSRKVDLRVSERERESARRGIKECQERVPKGSATEIQRNHQDAEKRLIRGAYIGRVQGGESRRGASAIEGAASPRRTPRSALGHSGYVSESQR